MVHNRTGRMTTEAERSLRHRKRTPERLLNILRLNGLIANGRIQRVYRLPVTDEALIKLAIPLQYVSLGVRAEDPLDGHRESLRTIGNRVSSTFSGGFDRVSEGAFPDRHLGMRFEKLIR